MTKIETEEQYKWAVERVERLLPMVDDDTPIDNPNLIELNLLSNLVADYSDEHYSVGEPSLADILRLRMEEMRLTPQSLSSLIGISISKLGGSMEGAVEPTFQEARCICQRLNIDANIVLGV